MPEQFGQTTHHVIHKHESHKLHQRFSVPHDDGNDVFIGMPVKLSPISDFTVQPLAAADNANLCIGVAIHDTDMAAFAAGSTPRHSMKTTYGDLQVTVAMKAAVIAVGGAVDEAGDVGGAVVPGPVKFLGYDTTTPRFPHPGVNTYMNCLPNDIGMIGWALEAADPGEEFQVALIY
jgi:hypothetical protein